MACNEWRIAAKRMLKDGYGAEDIAVRLDVPYQDVRQFINALRASGRLTEVLFGRRYRGEA